MFQKDPTFHRMAECSDCKERIEDPIYVNGKAYCEVDAEIHQDYNRASTLKKNLRKAKKYIRMFK